jgi:uncharacterized membrane protein HdeD (DUF308 family)
MAYFKGEGALGAGPRGRLSDLGRYNWHSALGAGIVAVVLGVIVLAWPGRTLLVLGVLFGIYLVVTGILQVIAAAEPLLSGGLRALSFVSGVLFILLGLMCFRSVFRSVVLLGIWIGIGWLFRGIAGTFAAFDVPPFPGRGWAVFFSLITAIAGIVLITDPVGSLATLAALAGIWLIILGAMEIGHAFGLRSRARSS